MFLDAIDIHNGTPIHNNTLHSSTLQHATTPMSDTLASSSMAHNVIASQMGTPTTPSVNPIAQLPAPPELTYMSSDQAIAAMMGFARENGYGMSLKRSKPDGKGMRRV